MPHHKSEQEIGLTDATRIPEDVDWELVTYTAEALVDSHGLTDRAEAVALAVGDALGFEDCGEETRGLYNLASCYPASKSIDEMVTALHQQLLEGVDLLSLAGGKRLYSPSLIPTKGAGFGFGGIAYVFMDIVAAFLPRSARRAWTAGKKVGKSLDRK